MPPYASICPIQVDWEDRELFEAHLPLPIVDLISFGDVSAIIKKTDFDIWTRYYGQEEIDRLKRTRYALVRNFECEHSERHPEEKNSEELLYRLYLGLKIIRPTQARFQVFKYEMDQAVPMLPGYYRSEYSPNVLDCERMRAVRRTDLQELATLGPSILDVLRTPSSPISQSIMSLEIGYRADFFNISHLIWVVGLDALFTSSEPENQGRKVAVGRITDLLGPDFEIYPEKRDPYLPSLGSLLLRDVVGDVYRLRNDFAHGSWPDKKWAGRVCRRRLEDLDDIVYGGVLLEAASAILRGCLKKILSDARLIEMFNDKTKMNAYFASRGFVRNQKRKHP